MTIRKDVLKGAAAEMTRLLRASKVHPLELPSLAHGSALERRLEDEQIAHIQDYVTAGEWERIVGQAAHLALLASVAASEGLE